MSPAAPDARKLARALAHWFGDHARDLPWRRDPGPYEVLVSEVMLQQTTVETAIPYYERFLAAYPDVAALAGAREAELLAVWSGLGYYRRARNLLAAARAIVRSHGGRIPESEEALRTLPGIGPYTAAAVMAIAFGRPALALDGNLQRVLARLIATKEDPATAKGRRLLTSAGMMLVSEGNPSVLNQALMDLGSSVCTPRAPRCPVCPLAQWCAARTLGIAERIPLKARRPASVAVHLAAVVLKRNGRIMLRQRTEPLMTGMWEVPMVAGESGAESSAALRDRFAASHGVRPGPLAPAGRVLHTITRHRIRVDLYESTASSAATGRLREAGAPCRESRVGEPRAIYEAIAGGGRSSPMKWFAPGKLRGIPLTGISRKILRAAPAGRPGRGKAAS